LGFEVNGEVLFECGHVMMVLDTDRFEWVWSVLDTQLHF